MTVYQTRLNRLIERLPLASLDGLVVNPGPSQVYLTGVHFYLFERPILLLLSADPQRRPALVLPELEVTKARSAPVELELFVYQDNPATWTEAIRKACRYLDWERRETLALDIEEDRLRMLEARFVQSAVPQVHWARTGQLSAMRMHKDEQEIALMRRAVQIAEGGLTQSLPLIRAGMTEKDLSAEIGMQVQRAGSEGPSNPMVAAGPNGANPHASVSSRKLQPGDLLVIDFGALYQGYCADLTRTFAVSYIPPEYARIAQVATEANTAGRSAAQPGVTAGSIDRAARDVIEAAGYGPFFIHRTGHGLGCEPHEEPYLFAENPLVLEPGMVFTVEPGIYLPGQAGARVEDDVVITPAGSETLSTMPRELIVVG